VAKSSFVSGSASCGVNAPAECLVAERERLRERGLSLRCLVLSAAVVLHSFAAKQMLIENGFSAFTKGKKVQNRWWWEGGVGPFSRLCEMPLEKKEH